jgi:hypothetical protein
MVECGDEMKFEKYCIDEKGNICCDYHEGLCMARDSPKYVSTLKKCPYDCVTFTARPKR